MKVKVGSHLYDSEYEPIMVILSDKDKENISKMTQNSCKYICAPADMEEGELKKWIRRE